MSASREISSPSATFTVSTKLDIVTFLCVENHAYVDTINIIAVNATSNIKEFNFLLEFFCLFSVCFGQNAGAAVGSAVAGGLIAVGAAVALAGMSRQKAVSDFVLAGIAIRALADSFIMAMKYLADPERQLASIEYWTMGSLSSITAEKLMTAVPAVLIGFICLMFFRWQIQMLSLADDEAAMLGVSVRTARIIILILTTLMVAGIVSVTGAISFVGLVAPHIARMILKENGFSAGILSGITGSIIILAADCLARSAGGSEIPISILTSLLGVPMMIWLLMRQE